MKFIKHSILAALVFTLTMSSAMLRAENDIKPFTTDGCSSFPNGTFEKKNLWLACCTAHDFTYWQGGTYIERVKADESFKQCIIKVGKPTLAKFMLAGVRVGGTPYLPTPFRWGYGWPFFRGYKAVNEQEAKQIKVQLNYKLNYIERNMLLTIQKASNNTCSAPLHCKL